VLSVLSVLLCVARKKVARMRGVVFHVGAPVRPCLHDVVNACMLRIMSTSSWLDAVKYCTKERC